ncbi:MAG: Rrf2 family transcriptional regulator [Oscillospiraceae bacterium]|nr:Rrf2 family transcriptional regulator [Oscillospiraceae bacterium]
MKVSTRGRYALRMLLELASRRGEGFVSLKTVAEKQGISKQYLEQIVALLHTSDIIRAERGKQGGYMLAKDPAVCTVGQVLRVTEGGIAPVDCLEGNPNPCPKADVCATLPMWAGLGKVIADYLDGVTLQDMLDRRGGHGSGNYTI